MAKVIKRAESDQRADVRQKLETFHCSWIRLDHCRHNLEKKERDYFGIRFHGSVTKSPRICGQT